MYLSLYCKGSKRLFKVLLWEGVGDRTKTAIFWPPLLWPSTLCLSRSPDAQPEAQRPSSLLDDGFLYCNSSISPAPTVTGTHQGPQRSLRPDLALPTTSPSPTQLPWLLSWLSSTPTQSPTRSLELNVGSLSSGNNCHAVQRSFSSGASVYESIIGFFSSSAYECIMGILYLVPFHQPIPAHAISSHNCH